MCIRDRDDIVNVADSLLVFHFCDDLGLASPVVDVFPELGNMGGIPDEGHGYVVRLAFYGHGPVSYTHLDVYKRQASCRGWPGF